MAHGHRNMCIFNIGFRLIYACHRNARWSQEHTQFSIMAFVSFVLVTGIRANFSFQFCLILSVTESHFKQFIFLFNFGTFQNFYSILKLNFSTLRFQFWDCIFIFEFSRFEFEISYFNFEIWSFVFKIFQFLFFAILNKFWDIKFN